MWSRENLADMLFVFRMRKTVYHTVIRGLQESLGPLISPFEKRNLLCLLFFF